MVGSTQIAGRAGYDSCVETKKKPTEGSDNSTLQDVAVDHHGRETSFHLDIQEPRNEPNNQ